MIKITRTYEDEETRIKLSVKNNKVTVTPGTNTLAGDSFKFKNSDPRTVLNVCNAIIELVRHAMRNTSEL
jgi:hypothetical protein